jgi:hypothetical protein
LSGDRHHLQQAARLRRQPAQLAAQRLVQRQRLERVGLGVEAAHQFDQQERIAARLAGELRGKPADALAVLAQLRDDQCRAFPRRQRPHLDLAVVKRHSVFALQLLPLRQEGAARGFVAAVGADEQQRRRLRRPQHLEERLGAVGVAPLQVVDEPQHQGTPADAAQQRTQSPEGPLTHLLVIEIRGRSVPRPGHHLDALEYRKHVGQHPNIVGHEQGGIGLGQGAEVAAEGIDDAVQGLEGHRLAVVTPTRHHCQMPVLPQGSDEVLPQGRLALARAAADEHCQGLALLLEGANNLRQRRQVLLPAHQLLTRLHSWRRSLRAGGDRAGHLLGVGALLRLPRQQTPAQRCQVRGDAGILRQRRGIEVLLVLQHAQHAAGEGRPATGTPWA